MNDRRLILGVIVMITILTTISAIPVLQQIQQAEALFGDGSVRAVKSGTQTSIFENNIYAAWFSNKSGNVEVMFRVSGDGGKTFGDKINLSNSPNSDSVDVDISSDENNVAVSWWERNQTTNEPVMRISNDNGKNFGEKIMLSSNGPIG